MILTVTILIIEDKGRSLWPERVACLETDGLLHLSFISQGSHWASGDGISVHDHPPLASNTPGSL